MTGAKRPAGPKIERRALDGWICLDKPLGLTSTQAVGRLRFLLRAEKAGHAGTLDPLATGVLPIAFGEATKTVPIVQAGEKEYEFTVQWGAETATDDAEGEPTALSDRRPSPAEIEAILPRFTGLILQRPPSFSAIKVDGARAYDLARGGAPAELEPREIAIHALALVAVTPDTARFAARCGKGAYVRALARDMGQALGCFGHVTALRRTRVGPFTAADASADAVESAEAAERRVAADRRTDFPSCARIPGRPRRRGGFAARSAAPIARARSQPRAKPAYVSCFGEPVAIGFVEGGHFVSSRVLNARGA